MNDGKAAIQFEESLTGEFPALITNPTSGGENHWIPEYNGVQIVTRNACSFNHIQWSL